MKQSLMIKMKYILLILLLTFGFNQDQDIIVRDYIQNGDIDAIVENTNNKLYLVQLDLVNDSLLHIVEQVIPNLELFGGPSSYHRIIEEAHYNILSENITSDFIKIIDDDYIAPDSRDYWVQTIYGSNYYGSSGEIGNTCYCLDASNCAVVGFNDSWYNPFDYYGEAWWNFDPPEFDQLAEVRVYVLGAQCDNLPLYSETELSIKNNSCNWNSDFQVTLSLNYTENGPYIIPDNQLEDIWCENFLQPVIGSEDNYTVDWVRMELYYSCNNPLGPTNFQASNEDYCDYVQLDWDYDIDDSVNLYKLYRDNELITQLSPNINQYIDYQASSYDGHTYCIYSENNCGESETVCTTGSKKLPPANPENVYATDGNFQDQVIISWDGGGDNIIYNLYRDNILLSVLTNSQELVYIDNFVDTQNIYEYCVEASNDCGESSFVCDLGFAGIGDIGDINLDEIINVLDIILLLNFILEIEYPNDDELWLSDINSDQTLNVLDIIELVNIILE